jgi:hypothetical protein
VPLSVVLLPLQISLGSPASTNGKSNTSTLTVAVAVQVLKPKTVAVYVVLCVGFATGDAIAALFKPAAGAQLYDTPPAAVRRVSCPRQMLPAVADAEAGGAGNTVTATVAVLTHAPEKPSTV